MTFTYTVAARQLPIMTEKCSKCRDTAIQWRPIPQPDGSDIVRYSVGFCDCPAAKRYISDLYSLFALKARAHLTARDFLELIVQFHKPPSDDILAE